MISKRFLSIYLIVIVIITVFHGTFLPGGITSLKTTNYEQFFNKGDGTPENPYRISNITELQSIENTSNLDKHFILINDINANTTKVWNSGAGFMPIGNNSNLFTGSFDGKGYKIRGLFINRSDAEYQGLFGYIGSCGVVRNVTLLNSIVSGDTFVGGLVGNNSGTLLNCSINGNVEGSSKVGGLVGNNYHGTVFNCFVSANVSCSFNYIGGLVGLNEFSTLSNCYATGNMNGNRFVGGLVGSSNYGNVSNCSSIGIVSGGLDVGGLLGESYYGAVSKCSFTGTVSGGECVGGLVGSNWGTIYNCSATCNLSGSSKGGGLIGANWDGTVTNCSAAGNTSGTDYVGGLVGYNWRTVSNCFANVNVSGGTCVGGLVGVNSKSTLTNCYALGSVNVSKGEVGGLVGVNSQGTLTNCYASGGVNGIIGPAGGLVGVNSQGTVTNCYASGDVNGLGIVGGLVGESSKGAVSNCHASGDVTQLSGSSVIGGFVGSIDGGHILNCYSIGRVKYKYRTDPTDKGFTGRVDTSSGYVMKGNFWDNQTSGQISTSGNATGKNTSDMMRKSTFADAGWDIEFIRFHSIEVWYIDDELANAGPDQTVNMGEMVTFNGTSGGCFGRDYPRLGWTKSHRLSVSDFFAIV